MSQPQHPQPPSGQQPPPPGWGQPPAGAAWGGPPPPPKKSNAGKIVGFGCLGFVGFFLILGIIGALLGDSGESSNSGASKVTSSSAATGDTAAAEDADEPTKKAEEPAAAPTKKAAPKVTFKVWGSAPAGASITYGSDTENIEGRGVPMTKTLKLDDDALYYSLWAQLQGGGDIYCSITIDGKTKEGHAKGGYNICRVQLSQGFLGGWD
jgi:hypothetical protein